MAVIRAGFLRLLLLGVVFVAAAGVPLSRNQKATCGYESCPKPKPGMLNVHLVPHSHDDVGWLKTVDQYYYGSNNGQQKASVQYILDSVIIQLQRDPKKRFIQVEMAFFTKWWKEQDEPTRELVKSLVQNGQLEFTGGAWSMNDEAATNYQSTIDQFTLGYRFLNDTFGSCGRPRVAWQIDPFGHSRGFALLVSQLGLDGVFLNRIDSEDRQNRVKTKTPEMVWNTSPNLGQKADLFASVLYRHYGPPPGFCYDDLCGDDPIVDDEQSPDYNVESKLTDFTNYVKRQAEAYTTDNVLLTMGDDFHYSAAGMWYKNLDKLIKYLNAKQASGGKINAFYSTPSCYVKAVNEANNTWITKQDDFFPYGGDPHNFFSGYYSSRPTQKYMERLGNNFLQVVKQASTSASLTNKQQEDITVLKEAMGVLQHHDAITGTEREHVARDYARIMTKGYNRASGPAAEALRKLTKSRVEFSSCFGLNISQCDVSEEKQRFVVTVYNPLGQRENSFVRLPVQQGTYSVRDAQGKEQKIQLVPIPEAVLQIPGRTSKATHELVLYAEQLPPVGLRSYFVEKKSNALPAGDRSTTPISNAFEIGFGSSAVAEIDGETKLLNKVTRDGVSVNVKQNFFYWTGANGEQGGSSGAYIFRPIGDVSTIAKNATVKVYKGDLVEEIHQTYTDWISQVIRTYVNEKHVELVWQVGPIPVNDGKSKEVINRLETDFKTQGIFFTDANGREILQRKRDYRPTWDVHLQEKVAGNYYPVNSKISIRDEGKKQRVTLIPDRGEGGTSIQDGQIELMVHRRLLFVDGTLGEALNETAFEKGLVVRGTHLLFAGNEFTNGQSSLAAEERLAARRQLLRKWLFFTDASDVTFEQWQKQNVHEFSGLTDPLPANVHLLTLEQLTEKSLLVRLEHFFEKNDDPELSKPATVNLQTVLKPFKVVGARETTLGGNQWRSESKRFSWNTKSAKSALVKEAPINGNKETDNFSVTLNPMEIRTFIVNIGN